jgi:hypothetical protein
VIIGEQQFEAVYIRGSKDGQNANSWRGSVKILRGGGDKPRGALAVYCVSSNKLLKEQV